MVLDEALELTETLLKKHGLYEQGWRAEADSSKRRFGVCRFRWKVISLSGVLVVMNSVEQVTDTILHEIAHALVGPKHGHDWTWKLKAMEIGAKPKRCFNSQTVITPKGHVLLTCTTCGRTSQRFKRPSRRLACTNCCVAHNGGKFSEQFLLKVTVER